MSIKTTLKTSVAAAALFAVAAPVVSSPALAGLANGNDNGVVISGSLNRAMQYVDNGKSNRWANVDGGTDNSRLRILVSGQLTESIKVGGTWEANLPLSQSQGNTTSTIDDTSGNISDGADSAFSLRKSEIMFTHATMGKFSIGQGTSSGDNKVSLDGTSSSNSGMSHGAKMMVYDKTGDTQTTKTGGGQFASYFGGRMDRLRYDTPSLGGVKASVSLGDSNFVDMGLTYGATFGDTTVAAAFSGTRLEQPGPKGPDTMFGLSIGAKHASGLSGASWYGEEQGVFSVAGEQTVEGNSFGVEAGYTTTSMSSLGATSVNIVYTESEEATADLYKADLIGIHTRQKLPAGVDLYASYEVSSFDDGVTTTSLDDISVFLIGTRLQF